MEAVKAPMIYLVVLNRDQVLGEFKNEEDAKLFAYICALHGSTGEVYETYEVMQGYEVGN